MRAALAILALATLGMGPPPRPVTVYNPNPASVRVYYGNLAIGTLPSGGCAVVTDHVGRWLRFEWADYPDLGRSPRAAELAPGLPRPGCSGVVKDWR